MAAAAAMDVSFEMAIMAAVAEAASISVPVSVPARIRRESSDASGIAGSPWGFMSWRLGFKGQESRVASSALRLLLYNGLLLQGILRTCLVS